ALAADVAVGPSVEGAAVAVRRQEPAPGEPGEDLRLQQQVRSAGQRDLRLAVPEAPAGHQRGHQRARAGRVARQAWTPAVEEVRDPVGRDAARVPRHAMTDRRAASLHLNECIIICRYAYEYSDGHTGQAVGWLAGVLERLPGDLEEHAMLRVEEDRFP